MNIYAENSSEIYLSDLIIVDPFSIVENKYIQIVLTYNKDYVQKELTQRYTDVVLIQTLLVYIHTKITISYFRWRLIDTCTLMS